MGRPTGNPEHIAAPVSADRERDRDLTMALVEQTGFHAYDAEPVANSWRRQCNSPVITPKSLLTCPTQPYQREGQVSITSSEIRGDPSHPRHRSEHAIRDQTLVG